jgi:integrase
VILIAFRHGLRASELVDLRWDQIDFGKPAVLHIRRAKNGTPATHPLDGEELRALRRLRRESQPADYVFVTERGAPFAVRGVQAMVERAGKAACFAFKVHPHLLRHACASSWPLTVSIRDGSRLISGIVRSSTR